MASAYNNNGLDCAGCAPMVDYGGAICQSLTGLPLDAWMSELVLEALEPAALEVSLEVAADVEAQRQRLHQHWAKRLERAGYEVDRAARQYHAVEPENRLVARTLERQWEEALASEEQLKADHRRFLASQPVTLSASEREAIRRLASDLPALWYAETTTAADRQAIIRQLVERVVVTVQGESEHVDLEALDRWPPHPDEAQASGGALGSVKLLPSLAHPGRCPASARSAPGCHCRGAQCRRVAPGQAAPAFYRGDGPLPAGAPGTELIQGAAALRDA